MVNGFAPVEMARLDEDLAKGHPVVAVERPPQSLGSERPATQPPLLFCCSNRIIQLP
jgi:hypothetical protein